MTELITFPDVEALCVTALNGFLTDCKASTKVPNPRPDKLVLVTCIGGIRRNVGIDAPVVLFECWSTDEVSAQELGARVRAFVYSMDEYGYEGSRLVNNPDSETNLPRYQFQAGLFLAAEPL